MEGWLQTLLILSIKASGVILLVMGVRWILGHRIPATLRYALWGLVLIRLALPVFPASPLSLFRLATVDPLAERIPGLGLLPASSSSTVPAQPAAGAGELSLSWPQILLGLWAAGAVLILLRRLAAWHRLRSSIAAARRVRDPEILSLLEECAETVGVSSTIEVRQAPGLPGPAVVGTMKPLILLPEDLPRRLEGEELRHVLLHELTHLRRRDGLIRGLARILSLLHWFNPLVHLGLRQMEGDCELACDAAVLRRLELKDRRAYGRTLLFLTTAARPLPTGMGVGMSAKRQLKRRIEMISRFKAPGRRGLLLGLGLFALLATVALTDMPVLAGAPASDRGAPSDDFLVSLDRAKITIQRTRNIGTAMWAHLTEICSQNQCQPPKGFDVEAAKAAYPGFVTWSDCPAISYQELEAKLVPAYIAELPRFDGFGNRFEFCFRPSDQLYLPYSLVGVRSPGQDGVYQGDTYTTGAFPGEEVERDVLWQDGYFITWPSRPKTAD